MAAARMQRWSLILSAYHYSIEHVNGTANQCADCMSRLPLPEKSRDSAEKAHIVIQGNDLPVTASQIAKESERDSELSIVMKSIQYGRWPGDTSVKLGPFHKRRHELTLLDGCVLWGSRVIIPKVFRKALLQELHTNHLGMSRMKSLARSYFWWPGLDAEIEELVRNCVECSLTSRNPLKAPAHPWLVPQHPWQRVHVDHAQFKDRLLLVAIDAYSKWPEVHVVSSTSAQQTIDKLRGMFACHGLPTTLVFDNGSPFQSAEFHKFMTANGILHRRVPPYHPASNGLAENMVKTVKHALSKVKITKDATIETHIAHFLATYRNSRHATTLWTPAELLFNRSPRTRLSLVHPCTPQRVEQSVELKVGDHQPRAFIANDEVMVRDLRPKAADKWRTSTVTRVLGPLNYEVLVDGHTRQAHIDHLLPGQGRIEQPAATTPATVPPNQPVTSPDIESDSTIVPLSPLELGSSDAADTPHQELVTLRPIRNRHSPQCLIEEMS